MKKTALLKSYLIEIAVIAQRCARDEKIEEEDVEKIIDFLKKIEKVSQ
jgi:hypothetical protein